MWLNLVDGFGIFFIVMGIGVAFNSKRLVKVYTEIKNGAFILFISGGICLASGLVIIALNVPVGWKTWVVEVIGLLAILKGVFLFVTPSAAVEVYKFMRNSKSFVFLGIVCVLLGLILLL